MWILEIEGDYNDADYVTDKSSFDTLEKLNKYLSSKSVAKVIQLLKDNNGDVETVLGLLDNEEEKDVLVDMKPWSGVPDSLEVHTIESIEYYEVSNKTKLI